MDMVSGRMELLDHRMMTVHPKSMIRTTICRAPERRRVEEKESGLRCI